MLYFYNETLIFHHFLISNGSTSTSYLCVFFLTSQCFLKLPLLQQADSVPSSSSCTSALGNPYGYVEHSAPIIGPQDAGNLQIKTIGHSWKGHVCQDILRNQVFLAQLVSLPLIFLNCAFRRSCSCLQPKGCFPIRYDII